MIDWFYEKFGKFVVITEEFEGPDGVKVVREVKIFNSDPAWVALVWGQLIAGILMIMLGSSLAAYAFLKESSLWGLQWWMPSGAIGIVGIAMLWGGFFVFRFWTVRVRPDQNANRQIFGATRFFHNTPILAPKGLVELAFFRGELQDVKSEEDDANDALAVRSFIMQQSSPKNAGDTLEIPRHEQLFVLQVVFRLGILSYPQLLSERFFASFHKRWQDGKHDAMSEVREKVLKIVVALADGVLQDFSMPELNANVAEANEALAKALLAPLRRLGIELEKVIIVEVRDMPGTLGYQGNTQRTIEALQKSEREQAEATADKESRVKRATENALAAKQEQESRKEIVEKELLTLQALLENERKRQEIAVQEIIARMSAMTGHGSDVAILKLQEMKPEDALKVLTALAANLNPNLQGATLVSAEGLSAFIKALPANNFLQQMIDGILDLAKKQSP